MCVYEPGFNTDMYIAIVLKGILIFKERCVTRKNLHRACILKAKFYSKAACCEICILHCFKVALHRGSIYIHMCTVFYCNFKCTVTLNCDLKHFPV